MLDSKTLHDFLSANVHKELYPQLFVISRKGKLVAYSTTDDISGTESEAALVAMIWREKGKDPITPDTNKAQASNDESSDRLKALTIESNNQNILVRPIQSNMLLVLVGGVPAGTFHGFKITPETTVDDTYPPDDGKLEKDVVAMTSGSPASHTGLQVLRLQRRKLDLLAETIVAEAKVVRVPDDS